MRTPANESMPAIIWQRGELNDVHDHVREYGASGESMDGRSWSGNWEETDGEFIEITNIEEV